MTACLVYMVKPLLDYFGPDIMLSPLDGDGACSDWFAGGAGTPA